MEKFQTTIYTENCIELKTSEELDKLYKTINEEENFIIQWIEKGAICSEVIIVTNIASKVKTGDLKLTAKEQQKR